MKTFETFEQYKQATNMAWFGPFIAKFIKVKEYEILYAYYNKEKTDRELEEYKEQTLLEKIKYWINKIKQGENK
jgi:hypothetical protein